MARLTGNLSTDPCNVKADLELETCIVCEEGKHGGIHIFGKYICSECERKIVNTEVETNQYRTYVKKMRQIFNPAEKNVQ